LFNIFILSWARIETQADFIGQLTRMLCLGGNKVKMRGTPKPAGDDVTTLDYFHGVMSRTPAVNVLTESGLTDGLYLLRLSPRDANQCAIAICYHKR